KAGNGCGNDIENAVIVEVAGRNIHWIATTKRTVAIERRDGLKGAVSIAVEHSYAVAGSVASIEGEKYVRASIAVKIGNVQRTRSGGSHTGEKHRCESASCVGENVIRFLVHHAPGIAAGILIEKVDLSIGVEVARYDAGEGVRQKSR